MDTTALFATRRNMALGLALMTFVLAACNENRQQVSLPRAVSSPSIATASASSAASSAAATPAATPAARQIPVTTPTTTLLPSTPPAQTDSPPQITGSPKRQITVDQAYSFAPSVHDADGDAAAFEIANRPAWLTFNPATGQLSGTPTAENVGVYRDVTIQVQAGGDFDTLQPFDIEVVAVGTKSVTLSWVPPTQNEDGSALTDLAGYEIHYGDQPGNYTNVISVDNSGLSSYVVEGLASDTYYFVMTAYNSKGLDSGYSAEIVRTL